MSVVSIVRFSIMMGLDLTSSDVTFNFTKVVIWSIVEINCGLICACLPSLRPAIRLLGLSRMFGSSNHSRARSAGLDAKERSAANSDALRPYRRETWKRPTLFSTSVAEPVTYGGHDEEDSYEMIRRAHDELGQTVTSVGPSRHSAIEERVVCEAPLAIGVKRDWMVSEEPVHGAHGV